MRQSITQQRSKWQLLSSSLFIAALLWLAPWASRVVAQSGNAQVTIQQSVNPIGAIPTGQNFTYTLLYSCTSITVKCRNVRIIDQLPPEVEFIASVGSTHTQDNGQYDSAARTVTFAFKDPLPAGSTGDLKIMVRFPNGSTPNGSVATNKVTMTQSNGSPATNDSLQNTAVAQSRWTISKTGPATASLSNGSNNTIYTLKLCADDSTGSLNLNNVQMVDTLPAGVQLVKADNNPAVTGNTLTWNLGNLIIGKCATSKVTVRFPAANFAVGASATNSVSATGQPVGQNSAVTIGPSTTTTVLTDPVSTPDGSLSKDTSGDFAVGAEVAYKLKIENKGSVALSQFRVTDILPAQFHVTRLTTGKFSNPSGATYTVRYRTNQTPANQWLNWATVTDLTKSQTLEVASLGLGAGLFVTAVQLEFGTVPPGFTSSSQPTLSGVVISPDHDGKSVPIGLQIQNCATLDWSDQGASHTTKSCKDKTVVKGSAEPEPQKLISGTISLYRPGSVVGFRLRVRNSSSATRPLSNPVVADLLPAELEYVEGSDTYEVGSSQAPPPVFEKVVEYDGTGRTLLRWRWPTSIPIKTEAFVTFQARIKPNTRPGTLVNSYGITSNGIDIACSGGAGSRKDVNDLDGDGDRDDTLCYGQASLEVQVTATLDSIKEVKGELDAGYVRLPDTGLTVPGGIADYRLTITNSGNITMTGLTVIDILPYINDTGVLTPSLRESLWRPNLAASVSAPTGVAVYYSKAQNPCRSELKIANPVGCVDDWSPDLPDDITAVQALKFDFAGVILAPGQTIQLTWPMRAPTDAPTNGETAWNSFAYIAKRSDNGNFLLATEPNKVGIALKPPPLNLTSYGDLVWDDRNHDGLQDTGEPGLSNVRVELYQPGGDNTVCTSDDQLVQFTVTDANGRYLFPALPAGDYYALFFPPDNYRSSPALIGGDPTRDSNGLYTPCQGREAIATDATHLDPNEIDHTWDQGFYRLSQVATVGDYVWFDTNQDGIQNEPADEGSNGVMVELHFTNGALLSTTVTADDVNGQPGYYLFENLQPGDYYLVFSTLISATFTLPDQGSNDEVDSDADPSSGKTPIFTLAKGQVDRSWDAGFIRTRPPSPLSLGDLIWLDNNNNGLYEPWLGEEGKDGVDVILWSDTDRNGVCTPGVDQLYNDTTTTTLNGQPGYYHFAGLHAGDYIVSIAGINFTSQGALHNLISSLDNTPAPDPDDDIPIDDNGEPVNDCGVASRAVTLTPGQEPTDDGDTDPNTNLTVDFGFYDPTTPGLLGALGDQVWLDSNNNSQQDNEPGINGVTLNLTGPVNLSAFTTADGVYRFDNLPAGTYQVTIDPATLPPGLQPTYDADGVGTPHTALVILDAGQTRLDIDFGYAPAGLKLKKTINNQEDNTPPGPRVVVSSTMTWRYEVTNTGKLTIKEVRITDDNGTSDLGDDLQPCPDVTPTLQPNERYSCEIRQLASRLGPYTTTATATGQPVDAAGSPVGEPVRASDLSYYEVVPSTLEVEPRSNGLKVDQPGLCMATPGTIAWSYIITNTGQDRIVDIKLTDEHIGPVICPATSLEPGKAMTCTAIASSVAGEFTSRSEVSGQPVASNGSFLGERVHNTATSYYVGRHTELQVEKQVNGKDADQFNDIWIPVASPITFTYWITNLGETTLSTVVITDTDSSLVPNCPPGAIVAPGTTLQCTATGTAVERDQFSEGHFRGQVVDAQNNSCGNPFHETDPTHYRGYRTFRLTLVPEDAHRDVGTTHTLTATVLISPTGEPMVNADVNFVVEGLNRVSGVVTTNAAGQAPFTYMGRVNITATGELTGTDVVTAWVDQNNNDQADPTGTDADPLALTHVYWNRIDVGICHDEGGTVDRPLRQLTVKVTRYPEDPIANCNRPDRPVVGVRVGFVVTDGTKLDPEFQVIDDTGLVTFSYTSTAPREPAIQASDAPIGEVVGAAQTAALLTPTAVQSDTDLVSIWVELSGNDRLDAAEPFDLAEETTAVQLVSFTAQAENDRVLLRWTTAVEIDHAGFNLYRARTVDGEYLPVNSQFIGAQGDGYGADYEFSDVPLEPGQFFYKLEAVSNLNIRNTYPPRAVWFGTPPISDPANRLYFPLVQR